MSKSKFLFAIIGLSALLLACGSDTKISKPVNNSIGYIGELNITTDFQTYDYLRDALINSVASPQPYLSPSEAFYKLNFIAINSYNGSYPEYQLQLLIVTEENKKELQHLEMMFEDNEFDSLIALPQVSFIQKRDVWVKNQSIFFLIGPSAETIRLYLNQEKETIKTALYNAELKDYAKRACNKKHPLSKILESKYGIGLALPDFFELDIQEDGFYSANWEEGDANCNLLISILPPSTDTALYLKETTLAQRDKDGKKYLPMDSVGIFYLGTSKVFNHFYEPYNLNGYKGSKINGYWVIEGLFRGGPFTRYTVYHPPSGRWIAIEGLVYYPNLEEKQLGKTKTRYMRTLESIIHTLR